MSWIDRWSPWRLRAQVAESRAHAERHADTASRWLTELCSVEARLVLLEANLRAAREAKGPDKSRAYMP